VSVLMFRPRCPEKIFRRYPDYFLRFF